MSNNVMIPMPLLRGIVNLLDYWDISKYDRAIQDDYRDILRELMVKMQKIELRVAYAKIISAKSPDQRDLARIQYLQLRNQVGDVGVVF